MLENVYEGLNARKCVCRLKCSKMRMKAEMLENVYEGINASQNCAYDYLMII